MGNPAKDNKKNSIIRLTVKSEISRTGITERRLTKSKHWWLLSHYIRQFVLSESLSARSGISWKRR